MSLSQLLGKIQSNVEKQPKEHPDNLYNPEIPDESVEIPTQYYKIYKATSRPRNGVFSLGKKRIYEDEKMEQFSKTGSINPETIASINDPDYVPSTLKTQGKYSLTDFDIQPPKPQTNLIKEAHKSYLNYLNRFSPENMPDIEKISETLPQPRNNPFQKFRFK